MHNNQQLVDFFAQYEERTNRALREPPEIDIDATVQAFADCFIGATPHGVQCGNNDDRIRETMLQGFAFYRSIGTRSMVITSLKTTPLDEWHSLVSVDWKAEYRKRDGSETVIEFEVIYLVQVIGETPKIFGYITGDEQKAYQEHGLV
jgi:hypothetical protein